MNSYNPRLQRIIRNKRRPQPLYVRAKLEIIKMIRDGAFPEGKLPSETDLSEMLGISRTSIREALMALGRDGIITKRQGIGNLIHLSTLNARMRIDQIKDFIRLLENGGYRVSMKKVRSEWVDDPSYLGIVPSDHSDTEFLFSEILYYADDNPAIMTMVMVPRSVIRDPDSNPSVPGDGEEKTERSLGDFLNAHTFEEVSHSISVYTPVKATAEISSLLGIEEGDPIIEWEETYYGIYDTRLCFTRIMFHPELVKLTNLCKWD